METKILFSIFLSFLLITSCSKNKDTGPKLNLNFEDILNGQPSGWYIYPQNNYSVSLDSVTVKSGKYSMAIEFTGGSAYFQPITMSLPENYEGKNITLSGYIKTENVTEGWAGLWMQIDPRIAFDNMQKNGITGTSDWKKYKITLPLNPAETQQIVIGGLLAGKGKMWLDDLQIAIDGKDISDIKSHLKKSLSKNEIATLKKYIYPLRTYEPDGGNTDDLTVLNKLIGSSTVVALGENSHGSSEIFKMKNRIIQYLAANNGFDIFSMEANMPESYKLNDYTAKGKGNPNKLIAGMHFWTWRTEEVLNMVEWMRKFNQPKQHIEFTGFDMQFYSGAIDELRCKLKGNKKIESKIADLKNRLDEINDRKQQIKQDRGITDNSQSEIILTFIQHTIETSAFETSDKAWLQQNIDIIRQYLKLNNNEWRDRCMADNFMWIKENNPNSKFVIWAHNGHIMKTEQAMGSYLAQKLGDNYATFGFTFFDGSFTASGNNGLTSFKATKHEAIKAYPGTLEYLLNQLNEPIFILDLKRIKSDKNKDTEWLMKRLAYRDIGASGENPNEFFYRKISDDFDYLIFIRTSSPSTLLPN